MILTKTPSTAKQSKEFSLLIAIRFACLMAAEASPMDNKRVQCRLAALQQQLLNHNFTHTFASQYLNRFGELGMSFALKVCPRTLSVEVLRIETDNVLPMAV